MAATFERGEQLCAFLDDVYLLCRPDRVTTLFTLLRGRFGAKGRGPASPRPNEGLEQERHASGGCSHVGARRLATWVQLSLLQRRWKHGLRRNAVFGRPYRRCRISSVLGRFWSRAPTHEQTTHCALCLQANVLVMPRRTTRAYGTQLRREHASQVATLPMRMGGLGLISSKVLDGSVFWASWADALPIIGERNPEIATMALRSVEGEPPQQGCLAELQQATSRLDREGFWWRPTWQALFGGARPPENIVGEPSEWRHGWHSGHLLSLTPTSGRGPFCLSVPRLAKLTFVPTQEPMPALR